MSLLIFRVSGQQALVAVDTECLDVRPQLVGPGAASIQAGHVGFGHCSKMIPLAHMGCVLAFRGLMGFGHDIWARANSGSYSDLDGLAGAMLDELALAAKLFDEKMRAIGAPEAALPLQEVALIGWSEREQSMVGMLWCNSPETPRAFACEDLESSVQPWWPDRDGDAPDPIDVSRIRSIAMTQVARVREMDPGAPIGGRLIVAELTRDRMSVWSPGAL